MGQRDYTELAERVKALAALPDVTVGVIGEFESEGRSYPLFRVRMGAGAARVMIDAGIHGDEPAGVEAALRFIETGADDRALLSQFSFDIFPCNNPTGWERNTRENADGVDLNRAFNVRKPPAEAAIISDALQGNCFDLIFEMHEDIDAPGLYLYELAEDSGDHVGERIIAAVAAAGCPINGEHCIEGMTASGGIIRRKKVSSFRKTRLPLAIFAYRTCGGHVITLEPPASVLPFEKRVEVELIALRVALDALPRSRQTS